MDAWEELAEEEYNRENPNTNFIDLSQEQKKEEIKKVKSKVVRRLNYLTDAFYGQERFIPIFIRSEEFNDEQEKEQQDKTQKYEKKMEKLERKFCKCREKIKKLEWEISSGKEKGVLETDKKEDIRTLKHKQNEYRKEYNSLMEKAYYFIGSEKERFAELNNLEKELFGILMREIQQKDLEKIRYNKWEEFPLDVRERIVELLSGLCDKEQWRPVGFGKELHMWLIEYRLLHPREYRLIKVTEMMMSDEILQETKENVLEMMDKNILSAYKTLSKAISNIGDEVGVEEVKKQVEKGIKRHQDKVNGK